MTGNNEDLNEETRIKTMILPSLLEFHAKAGASPQGDHAAVQTGANGAVPLDDFIGRVMFRYAMLIAADQDRLGKWREMVETVRAADPFVAGRVAASVMMNIKEFGADADNRKMTGALADTISQRGVYIEALDASICAWLAATDEVEKKQARETVDTVIKRWEGHQTPKGWPFENNGPAACAQFMRYAAQNPDVKVLLADLRPDADFTPLPPPGPQQA